MDAVKNLFYSKYTLPFSFPAGTSRGILLEKKMWLISVQSQGKTGIGECSVIEGLSPEYTSDFAYETLLEKLAAKIQNIPESFHEMASNLDHFFPELCVLPSIRFGLETALRSWLVDGSSVLFDNPFTRGEQRIPINGLIWMGSPERMKEEIEKKLREGFRVLKFKIAALPWQEERALLESVRTRFNANQLEIRVDANGGLNDALWPVVFSDLKALDVHSIEQPLPPNNRLGLKAIVDHGAIPVALDESLITCYTLEEKEKLLKEILPPYIILKPSLMGGFKGVSEWITLADSLGIGWWITSALESNIGLNAIAQYVAEYPIDIPQGLGTGGLFTKNFPSPLLMENGCLTFQRDEHSKTSSQLV